MTTAAHQLLDHLLDDLKKELFEKMHQNIVLELEKQKRNLQNMVAEMLTERKGEMLVVMMNKVHREIMKEQEKIMKEQEKIMKEQEKMVEDMLAQRKEEMLEEMLNKVHREIKQEVEMYAQGTNAAMDDFMGEMKCQLYVHIQKMVEKEVSLQLQKKGDKKEEKKEEEKEEKKQMEKEVKGKVFFRRDIFKEKITVEEESQSLLANTEEEESQSLLANNVYD